MTCQQTKDQTPTVIRREAFGRLQHWRCVASCVGKFALLVVSDRKRWYLFGTSYQIHRELDCLLSRVILRLKANIILPHCDKIEFAGTRNNVANIMGAAFCRRPTRTVFLHVFLQTQAFGSVVRIVSRNHAWRDVLEYRVAEHLTEAVVVVLYKCRASERREKAGPKFVHTKNICIKLDFVWSKVVHITCSTVK